MATSANAAVTEAVHRTSSVKSKDGTELQVLHWQPAQEALAEVVVVPGYADHAARYRELAHLFATRGLATTAVDLRGHGRSAGQRGFCRNFSEYLDDVEAASRTATTSPRFLLGHSMGGLVALDFISSRSHDFAGLVVTNPYLDLAMPVPPIKLALGKFTAAVWPTLALPSGIDPAGISHDPQIVESYRRDPLVFKTATSGWFAAVLEAQQRVRALTELQLPLLYVHSDSDPIVSSAVAKALADTLTAPDKTVVLRPGEYHEVLNELDRATLHAQIADWILARAK